jgi:hypothetical protein
LGLTACKEFFSRIFFSRYAKADPVLEVVGVAQVMIDRAAQVALVVLAAAGGIRYTLPFYFF